MALASAAVTGARSNGGGRGGFAATAEVPGQGHGRGVRNERERVKEANAKAQARVMRQTHSTMFEATNPNIATGIATCLCTILVVSGLVSITASVYNQRAAKIADYDAQVLEWTAKERTHLEESGLEVYAQWAPRKNTSANATGRPANSTARMKTSVAEETVLMDVEAGEGLDSYVPLKFVSTFNFPGYYPNDTAGAWDQLPAKADAPTVSLQFSMMSKDGTVVNMTTMRWPLFWNEVVRSKTPAPETKCRREQRGTWRNGRCNVVKRLTRVCVQVRRDEAGHWMFNPETVMVGEGGEGLYESTPPVTNETFGCDPSEAWHPASYAIDGCWGPSPAIGTVCQPVRAAGAEGAPHVVEVIVRSAEDPLIAAEEITGDTLNFGASPESQRAYGLTMLAIGVCLCTIPMLRLYECWRSRRKRRFGPLRIPSSPGTAVSPEVDEAARAGVYGQSTM